MYNNNNDTGGLTQRLQQLQLQANKLAELQGIQGTQNVTPQGQPMATTYPKIAKKPESVEDILDNPVWRTELQTQFHASELGIKAKAHMDVMFSEFCEIATGYKSTMLEDLRKQVNAGKGKNSPVPKKEKEEVKNDA